MSFIAACVVRKKWSMAETTQTVIVSSCRIVEKPHVVLSKEDEKLFCLGVVGWCPCDSCGGHVMELSDTRKASRLSLKLKRKRSDFSSGVTEIGETQEQIVEPSRRSLSNELRHEGYVEERKNRLSMKGKRKRTDMK